MKLYFAAAESGLPELAQFNVKKMLISMANGDKKIPLVHKIAGDDVELIIDSGAFTYAKKGGISINNWLYKISKHLHIADEVISLDVINNPGLSLENYLTIKKEIDHAIPTFHVGSPLSYLDEYLKYTDRIAIGGMVPYKSQIDELRKLLNEIFNLCLSNNHLPKFHAFGYFSQDILENYPWYSADASTWQNYSRFGEIHVFKDMKYSRVKSLAVGVPDFRNVDISNLRILMSDEPMDKLGKIVEALKQFEIYLTDLWKLRGITWSD